MYTDNQTVQILISLLKAFSVRHAVLSPGVRNVPIVHSIEQDKAFQCYSVVDERSAAYFGLGLALQTGEPILISCTSGTASANYLSAMWEAKRQNVPLIALTADRNQYYLEQLEDQMIKQDGMFSTAVRKSVTLPIVEHEKDAWYCRRLVNEALLEMHSGGGGPVHINIPIEWGIFGQNFNTKKLPKLKTIRRTTYKDMQSGRIDALEEIKTKKRILVLAGQDRPMRPEALAALEKFAAHYPCAVAVETISNIHLPEVINTNLMTRALTKDMFAEYAPDLVISFGGNYVSQIKGRLKSCDDDFDHWCINEDGAVIDQFKKLTRVFTCSPQDFFAYFNEHFTGSKPDQSYRALWQSRIESLPAPNFTYSSNYAMQAFLSHIPNNSILHYGNGVAVHMAQYFPHDESIETYCHSGTTTIDGSLSTFIGQAATSDKLCFAFIGDLSFFYDMNALWNRYVGKNVRILLYNNEGGQTFHWNAAKDIETLPLHTSAEHFTTAKGWVESLGIKYLSATNKDELDAALPAFVSGDSDQAICLEVFTKKDEDGKMLHDYYDQCREHLLKLSAGGK